MLYFMCMSFLTKIFKKNKNAFKLSSNQEDNLVNMILTSKSINLNTKIIVPEDFCVILLSKDKFLDIIPSGEYELNGLTIPKTCKINHLDKPTKKGYKQKFDADFYYVNFKPFTIKENFFIKKIKQNISYKTEIKVFKPILFLEFLAEEKITYDSNFALEELTLFISQLIYYYILDNKVVTNEKLQKYLELKLAKIGVLISNFTYENKTEQTQNINLKMFNEDDFNSFNNTDSSENNDNVTNSENNTENDIFNYPNNAKNLTEDSLEKDYDDENKLLSTTNSRENNNNISISTLVNLDDIQSEVVSYFTCDNCGAKLPQNAKICFNCKKSFIEKNLCENCGKEIPKNTCVCPYCNSVILN